MEREVSMSRRRFIEISGKLMALSGVYAASGCERSRAPAKVRHLRRDLAGLSAADKVIQSYRRAIAIMKTLPPTDPRSLTFQARVYASRAPRSNWYFLPWHRACLAYFEKLCRWFSEDPQFAVPYWNWAANPAIPSVFQSGSDNPLFNSTRIATPRDILDPALTGPRTLASLLSQSNFFVFGGGPATDLNLYDTSGLLESIPHNYIQNFVGGNMATFAAPLDPLFWSHLAMIDRCWVEWNLSRRQANPNDPQWTKFSFTDFIDGQERWSDITAEETVLLPISAYSYEDLERLSPGELPPSDFRALEEFAQSGAPAQWGFSHRFELQRQVAMNAGRQASLTIRIDPGPILEALKNGRDRLLLKADSVDVPHRNDFFLRIFINKEGASAATPIDDPHYAGSFAMFSDEPHRSAEGNKPAFLADITESFRHLYRTGLITRFREAKIQLVAVPFPRRTPGNKKLEIGRLELDALRGKS